MMNVGPSLEAVLLVLCGGGLLLSLVLVALGRATAKVRGLRAFWAVAGPVIVLALAGVLGSRVERVWSSGRLTHWALLADQCSQVSDPGLGNVTTASIRTADVIERGLPVARSERDTEVLSITAFRVGERWIGFYRAEEQRVFLSFPSHAIGGDDPRADVRAATATRVFTAPHHVRTGDRLLVISRSAREDHRAELLGADLLGADLLGADLLGADLLGADLLSAELLSAELERLTELAPLAVRGPVLDLSDDGRGGAFVLVGGESALLLHLAAEDTQSRTALPFRPARSAQLARRADGTLCVRDGLGGALFTTEPVAPTSWPVELRMEDQAWPLRALAWALLLLTAMLLTIAPVLVRLRALPGARGAVPARAGTGRGLVGSSDELRAHALRQLVDRAGWWGFALLVLAAPPLALVLANV